MFNNIIIQIYTKLIQASQASQKCIVFKAQSRDIMSDPLVTGTGAAGTRPLHLNTHQAVSIERSRKKHDPDDLHKDSIKHTSNHIAVVDPEVTASGFSTENDSRI